MSVTVAETRKPLHHQLITDIIVFAPVLAIPAAIVDLYMHPMHGWKQSLLFALYALIFTVIGTKMRTLGISLGFHRQGTHPSYQTKPWLRGTFFMLGCTTAQGKMVNWLSDHHHHHIHSDEDEDLHSPRHGFWHAYIGWLRGLLFGVGAVLEIDESRMVDLALDPALAEAALAANREKTGSLDQCSEAEQTVAG